jgi:ureidoglycolate lyase
MNPAETRMLRAQPLVREAFQPFGEMIVLPPSGGLPVNQGRGLRHDVSAPWGDSLADTAPTLALYGIRVSALPLKVTLFERHPRSVQIFLPMVCQRYAVVVAPSTAAGLPDSAHAVAFIGSAGQGVLYHAGVWHHPIVALDSDAQFAMLMQENGTAEDCVTHTLSVPLICEQ